MRDGLRRELREELGIEVKNIKPLFFKDGQHLKSFADGSKSEVYVSGRMLCYLNTPSNGLPQFAA